MKERVRELETSLKKRGSTVFDSNAYWVKDGESKDGPFCQRCYDVDGTLVRLHSATFQNPRTEQWMKGALCRQCKAKHEYEIQGS